MNVNTIFETLPVPEPGYNPDWDRKFAQAGVSGVDLPGISIVTPSFNQGRFIEQTIRCILLQGYPNLEYIIIDGGSTDITVDIIKKYEPWLSYWVSEPDSGMYDAINKGFAKSTGEIMGWSPTGDLYEPDALNIVGHVFQQQPRVEWLTSLYKVKCDEAGRETARYQIDGFSREAFLKGLNFLGGNPFARYMVQQQSTFWRKKLWEKSGARMDDEMKGAGDFELWARFFSHGAALHTVDQPLGVFMTHDGQESIGNADRMSLEQEIAFKRNGGRHMRQIEGWLRSRVLRSRPFVWLKNIPQVGFRSEWIRWDAGSNASSLHISHFV